MVAINKTKSKRWEKVLSLFLILLATIYLLMPIDFDGPIIGLADDFLFFMASFCFCASRFTNHFIAKTKLTQLSIIFVVLALIILLLFAFTPLLNWIA